MATIATYRDIGTIQPCVRSYLAALLSPVVRVRGRTIDGGEFELGIEQEHWAPATGDGMLDLSDCWSLPGLADAHAHLAQDELNLDEGDPVEIRRRAYLCLERGVFLCLDKGWKDRSVLTLADVPPSDRPDLQAAGGMIAGPGGYFPGFGIEVDEAGLAEEVRRQAESSLGWVKLVGDWPRKGMGPVAAFGEEALRRAVQVAHSAGAKVAIHTMAPDVPSAAVRAGVDSIEHGLFLTGEDLELLGSRNGMWVPTVLRMKAVIHQLGADSSGGKLVIEGLERVKSLLPGAVSRGVRVLAGSDLAVPHGEISSEAIALARYGLGISDAVAAVSSNAYEAAGIEAGFSPGLPANLVAFERPPLEDVEALAKPAWVIRRGKVLLGGEI